MNIFLIGFMGSGKSYWGKRWADVMQMEFVDLDIQIEESLGKSVAEIFEKHGEDFFREMETKILKERVGKKPSIIACGGGTPCFNDNMPWMNEHGTTIWLKADAAIILDRVLLEQEKRPLLKKMNKAEILFFIEQKLKEREPFYSQANYIFSIGELTDHTLLKIAPQKNA